jgi:hypothetical protein
MKEFAVSYVDADVVDLPFFASASFEEDKVARLQGVATYPFGGMELLLRGSGKPDPGAGKGDPDEPAAVEPLFGGTTHPVRGAAQVEGCLQRFAQAVAPLR